MYYSIQVYPIASNDELLQVLLRYFEDSLNPTLLTLMEFGNLD